MTAILDHKADLAAYIADNYGECKLDDACKCTKGWWIGAACPNWVPVRAQSWEELKIALKQQEKKRCALVAQPVLTS